MFLSGSTLSKMNQWIGSLPSTNQDDNFEWQFFFNFDVATWTPKSPWKKSCNLTARCMLLSMMIVAVVSLIWINGRSLLMACGRLSDISSRQRKTEMMSKNWHLYCLEDPKNHDESWDLLHNVQAIPVGGHWHPRVIWSGYLKIQTGLQFGAMPVHVLCTCESWVPPNPKSPRLASVFETSPNHVDPALNSPYEFK